MKNKSLTSGAIILIVSSFINRLIGFLYKIFMVRIIGTEGIGLFQMVMPIFSFLLVITTAGIPPTISKLVSENIALGDRKRAKKTFKIALVLLTITSLTISIIGFATAPFVVNKVLTDQRVFLAYLSLIPAVIIVSFSSVFRGYFMGNKDMFPPAVSQIIETAVRFIIGLVIATYLLKYGIEFSVAGFSIGLVVGELSGLIVLLYYYKKQKLHKILSSGSSRLIIKNIYSMALPITVNRIILTLVYSILAIIIPSRLQFGGYSLREATSLYGQLTGIAHTIISLPTVFTVSLAVTMIPAISEAQASNNFKLVKNRSILALKYTILAGIPWAILFYILSVHLTTLLFKCPEAGVLLKTLSLGCVFIYLQQTTNGILQGLGKVNIIVKNSLVGAVITISGVFFLTATSLGIVGAAIAEIISASIVTILNLYALIMITGCNFKFSKAVVLSIGVIITCILTFKFEKILENYVGEIQLIIIIILLCLILYLIMIILLGFVSYKDVKRIPFFEYLPFNNYKD